MHMLVDVMTHRVNTLSVFGNRQNSGHMFNGQWS